MPCYTTRELAVEFEARNIDLLKDAVESMGGNAVIQGDVLRGRAEGISFEVTRGKMTIEERGRHLIDKLKRSYSKEIVKKAASRYGWALKETAQNKFSVSRR